MDTGKRNIVVLLLLLTLVLGIITVFITMQTQRNNAPDDSFAMPLNLTIEKFRNVPCTTAFAENESYVEIGAFTNITNALDESGILPEFPLSCSANSIAGKQINLEIELSEFEFNNDVVVSFYGFEDVVEADAVKNFGVFLTQNDETNSCKAVLLNNTIEDFKVGVITILESEDSLEISNCLKYMPDIKLFVENLDNKLKL